MSCHQLGGHPGGMRRRPLPSPGRVRAGVIPIDRLTDVRAPVAVIAARIPRAELEAAYSARLPRPAAHEPAARRAALSLLPGGVDMLALYAILPFVLARTASGRCPPAHAASPGRPAREQAVAVTPPLPWEGPGVRPRCCTRRRPPQLGARCNRRQTGAGRRAGTHRVSVWPGKQRRAHQRRRASLHACSLAGRARVPV